MAKVTLAKTEEEEPKNEEIIEKSLVENKGQPIELIVIEDSLMASAHYKN